MSNTRSTRPAPFVISLAVIVAALGGCRKDITEPRPDGAFNTTTASTGHDVTSALRLGAGAFRFEPLSSSAPCRHPEAPDYRPFDLPSGFSQTIIATQRADFVPAAGSGGDLPDMLTLNETGPQAGRYLYRTHEVGSNGAVTVTDLWTGHTSLVIQKPHYERLDGIVWTPWGTLLFAEEVATARFPDPDFPTARRGLVYELDPATGTVTARPAVGARPHEGMRFDSHGNLYGISETRGRNQTGSQSGAIFKFVPDRRGDLSSGQLYALKVTGGDKTGPARWVPLDRAASEVDSDREAILAGATGWERPEDVALHTSTGNLRGGANVMFVSVTGENLVLRIELRGDVAFVTNYVEAGVNVPDGEGQPDQVTAFDDPDNLALDPFGNLFIAEDEGPGDIWVALAGRGTDRVARSVVLFASLADCAAEPSGIYFDRNGQTLWVNVQHAGGSSNDLTVAIHRDGRVGAGPRARRD